MLRAKLLLNSLHCFLGSILTAPRVVISTIVVVVPILVVKVGVCVLVAVIISRLVV